MFWRGTVACTGTEFCKLAITETKGFARWLVDEMEERLPQFDQQLRLNVTGCPNGCGQHWIADIGIEGKKIKHEGKLTDAYYFCLGGAVGQHAAVARPVGYRCPAPLVPDAIERLLRHYMGTRTSGENLRAWFLRHTNDELRAHLAIGFHCDVEVTAIREGARHHVSQAFCSGLPVTYLDLKDEQGFRGSCVQGLELGFDGKTLIHPSQVEPCNEVFSPSPAELEQARKIILAHEEAEKEGKGVVLVDGKLIENLHVENAKRLVGMAEAIERIQKR
jgi:hypothetical protein